MSPILAIIGTAVAQLLFMWLGYILAYMRLETRLERMNRKLLDAEDRLRHHKHMHLIAHKALMKCMENKAP